MYKVKETFEYLVNDPNNFCSVHDALEMDTSMPIEIDDYPLYNRSNVHIIIRDKNNPWYSKYVTSSQYPYYKVLCEEELQRYIKNARQFFKTTAKNEENFYFSNSYGVLNVL